MSNDYYNPSGTPSQGGTGSSSNIRAEFNTVRAGFDKLPGLTGNGGKLVKVNAGATALDVAVAGVDYQAWSANLDEYAAVNPTAAGLALLDDVDAAAQLATLGAQPADADLTAIAGLAATAGMLKRTGAGAFGLGTANSDFLVPALANTAVTGFKTATFNSQATIATTSGSINIDWTAAQNYKQTEPTGTITYTFTAPPGPCHLQLLIDSDGTSTAQTINFPAHTDLGVAWAGVNNKKAMINFWYDGTNYFMMGINQA